VLLGGSGSDRLDCGPGNDVAYVNLRVERQAATGCETFLDEPDLAQVTCAQGGTAASEIVLESSTDDTCHGGSGHDDVEGAGGNDDLFGDPGDDRMFGRFGNDELYGGDGHDELEGGRGNDLLEGGAGNDRIAGGYGDDILRGGDGADVIRASFSGRDRVDCGPGRDVVHYRAGATRPRDCEVLRRLGG